MTLSSGSELDLCGLTIYYVSTYDDALSFFSWQRQLQKQGLSTLVVVQPLYSSSTGHLNVSHILTEQPIMIGIEGVNKAFQ